MLKFFSRPPTPPPTPQTHPVQLRPPETDASFEIGRRITSTGEYRNRYNYDRQKILLNCLEAWRVNPLARRAIELTTQYVIGNGITIKAGNNQPFLNAWRDHPANRINEQLHEWADELWRSGNLFLIGAVDDAGLTYWRPLPAELIADLETYANDPYHLKRIKLTDIHNQTFFAYKKGIKRKTFALHFPINRPAGSEWGESDLAPVLRYLALYTDWLIDRAAINKYIKPCYIVQKRFDSQTAKKDYAAQLQPPTPGSTTIADPDEHWSTLNPNTNATDSSLDGIAIKKMIAAGLGFPLHHLAEPESATRTTAEAAGTPTHRRLAQRQSWLLNIYRQVIQTTLEVRALWANDVDPTTPFTLIAPDISERDNAQMALSANRISSALIPFWDTLGAQEVINMVYRFAGETTVPKVSHAPLTTQKQTHEQDPEDETETDPPTA